MNKMVCLILLTIVGMAQAKSLDYLILKDTYTVFVESAETISGDSPIWSVTKGSQTYLLDEFVKSGRFCEWRGQHIWHGYFTFDVSPIGNYNYDYFKCEWCGHYRRKITKQKEVEEWEP